MRSCRMTRYIRGSVYGDDSIAWLAPGRCHIINCRIRSGPTLRAAAITYSIRCRIAALPPPAPLLQAPPFATVRLDVATAGLRIGTPTERCPSAGGGVEPRETLDDGRGDGVGPVLPALAAPAAAACAALAVCDASVSNCCAMTCKCGMYDCHMHAVCK